MRIRVQLFATVRERAGVADVVIELADGSTSEELWDALVDLYPALAPTRGSTAIARNDEYVGTDVVLEEGDEVAQIPPVSGGCGDRFDVTDKPLLIEVLCRQIAGGSAGATSTGTSAGSSDTITTSCGPTNRRACELLKRTPQFVDCVILKHETREFDERNDRLLNAQFPRLLNGEQVRACEQVERLQHQDPSPV